MKSIRLLVWLFLLPCVSGCICDGLSRKQNRRSGTSGYSQGSGRDATPDYLQPPGKFNGPGGSGNPYLGNDCDLDPFHVN